MVAYAQRLPMLVAKILATNFGLYQTVKPAHDDIKAKLAEG